MIEVCWIQHGGEAPWAQQIAQALKEHDINVKFVTTIRDTHEEYLKNGFESYFISQIFGDAEHFSAEDLAQLDQEYGPPLIQAIVDSDVHLVSTDERYLFASWAGDASGTDYSGSNPIAMDQPKTATASWDRQFLLTVEFVRIKLQFFEQPKFLLVQFVSFKFIVLQLSE